MTEFTNEDKQESAYASAERKRVHMKEYNDGESRPKGNRDYSGTDRAREGGEHRSEKQLLQSQRLEALGTLVGGIAHDFNNILNVITGHVTLMERWRTDPAKFMKSYEAVKKATERGANTAKQLLTFARKVDLVAERVSIGELIHEIVDLLKETFPENIAFNVTIEPNMPAIPADPNQIHQALLNLCVNARDAMPRGGSIHIDVRKVGLEDLGKHLRATRAERFVALSVSDSGSGMEKETLQHIFEPFFTTKDGFGTGLGLAVVYGVMKAHNGFIDVKSTAGKGTSFTLYFPVPGQGGGTQPAKKENVNLLTGHGEMILAIEDEEPLKDFLNTILTESGYRVLLASDGLEGLQTYREHAKEIDLVILDMGLPEMSGTEVLSGLLLLNPFAKVISASGYLEPEVKADALDIGALDFLAKPYRVEELLTKVHRALQATRG